MLKIILADNQAIFRAGAAKVMAVEDDLRIVAQVQTPDQVLATLEKFRAAVLLLAATFAKDLPSALESAHKLKTRVLIVTDNEDEPRKYVDLGADGVIFRNVTGTELVTAVRRIAQGETYIPEGPITKTTSENDLVGARVRDRLTPKELRIVALIVQGYKNKEIAQQLGTTEQVIKNYLRNVYDKIGVSDRLELALFTIHHKILAEAAAATAATAATGGQ
jgi:DNA-binding NarL/FixJ family response regulator